ncbi:MAG: hypothetical protein IPH28_20210 [Cytophagaceae bacterium]|nr:hypothetical protein [Cytophagaceae bacterium]
MKKLILSVGIGLIAGSVSAQVVNSTLIHVNEGAVLSLGSSVVNNGEISRSFEVKNLKGNTVEAKYVARNPMDVSTELDYNMEEINQTEYWVLSTANNADLDVKLSDNSDVAYLKGGVWVNPKRIQC